MLSFSLAARPTAPWASTTAPIQDFDQAIRLNPDDAAPFNSRCYARASAGQLASALADCSEAFRPVPGNRISSTAGLHLPEDAAVSPGARRLRGGAEARAPQASSCSGAASCAARWAMRRPATPTSPPPSRSMPRLPGSWRAAASLVSGAVDREPGRREIIVNRSDNGHTAPGGDVAGSRQAAPEKDTMLELIPIVPQSSSAS